VIDFVSREGERKSTEQGKLQIQIDSVKKCGVTTEVNLSAIAITIDKKSQKSQHKNTIKLILET